MLDSPRSLHRSKVVLLALIATLCLLSLEVRWYLCRQLPFIMDELVDTQLAVQVSRGAVLYLDRPYERMPLMTLVLSQLHDPADGSFESVIAARHFFWVVMVLTSLGTVLVARRFGGWSSGLVALGLLLGFSSFLERAVRVRADGLSTAASLPALMVLTAPRLQLPALFVAGLGLGLSWITTQKAVYFVGAFALALAARHVREEGWRRTGLLTGRAGISIAGFAVPSAGVVLWASGRGLLQPFFEQTLQYGAYVGLSASTYSFTSMFVGQTVARNPGFWALGLLGASWLLVVSLRRPARSLDSAGAPLEPTGMAVGPAVALLTWTVAMVVAILQHTTKFPYVFLNLSPPLAACGAFAIHRLLPAVWGKEIPRWRTALALVAGVALLVVLPIVHHARALGQDLIWGQKVLMDRIDALTEPDDAVLDGTGMAVARRKATPYSMTLRWHQERRRGADYPVIEHLRRSQPKIAIRNGRLRSLTPHEKEFIGSHFVHDWANLGVVGAAVIHEGPEPTETEVDLLASTRYAVLAEDLDRISLAGQPVQPVMVLEAGVHSVRIVGAPQRVRFRYAPSMEIPSPPPRPPLLVFPSYSD